MMKLTAASLVLMAACMMCVTMSVAEGPPPPRTPEELKGEAWARADRNASPLIGLRPGDVREALANIHGLDRDEWAAAWSAIGERYMKMPEAERASASAE